jgi:hypothetical protein
MKQLLAYVPAESDPFGIHREMVAALVTYSPAERMVVAQSLRQALALLHRVELVYLQKTSPKNIVLAIVARLIGRAVVLYVHEPLSTAERVTKGVRLRKAWAITTFQRLETFLASRLLSGNPANRRYHNKSLTYAPLLIQPVGRVRAWSERSSQILYFGRLDREKYFEELRNLRLPVTVVATLNLNITHDPPPVKPVSDQDKRISFESHKYVWCVQRHSLTQSAVVLDALRYGCCCLLREDDPIAASLNASEFILIPSNFNRSDIVGALNRHEAAYPLGPAQESSFDRLCGQAAYDSFWRIIF